MASYAALVSLMTIMDQINNHPRLSISLNRNQIETLGEKVGFLLDFIETHSHGVISEEAEVLESQIASAAYAAEDIIESHVVDQIVAGNEKTSSISSCCLWEVIELTNRKVIKLIHSMSLLWRLEKVTEQMDSIKKKVMELKDESRSKDLQPPYSIIPTTTSRPPLTTNKNTMVGFDEQLIQLLDKLTGQPSNRRIIPIVGMGGIGKTTLAKHAYEHSLIVQYFDIRMWVTVSQTYNVKGILLQLLYSQSSEINSETDEQLGEQLYKKLWGRRYLIVVDDIWSIDAWDKVKLFFPDNNNGSRVVVTTRISNVAIHFDSVCLELSFLDEDKSWDLFCEKAFGQACCPCELEDIGKEIAEKCKGLPLSIVVIGGLLGKSHRKQEHYWKNIAKDLISILNSGENEDCLNILSLSYTYLPAHLRPCFLYMRIFPEDHEIRVSELIKLWVAEGFIKPNTDQSLEEIARGYLDDLIDRNLILKHRLGSNGKTRTCKIHDLLRDLCLKVAHRDKFICKIEDIPRGMDRERRIVFNERIQGVEYDSRVFPALRLASSTTRTLLIRIDGGRLPFNNRLLRVSDVLDKSLSESTHLPEDFFDQVNLRYLRYNVPVRLYGELPWSISLLWNMQTLILGGSIVATSQIWEMRQLRHLDILSLYLPDPPPSSEQQDDYVVLQNLQTLKTVINLRLSEEVCKRVLNVRKLNIECRERSVDYCLYNLCRLHKLESLYVQGRGRDLLHKLKFPGSLKKLTLRYCGFHWEDLTMIGSLSHLEVLKLEFNSAVEPVWNPIEGEFLRLKFLLIGYCDRSHFPVLETLVLFGLEELDEIPLDIGEIPTLGVIRLDFCSDSLAISAMKLADEQESLGNEGLQVRVVFEKKAQVESFWENVEQSAESFTRSNFQVKA